MSREGHEDSPLLRLYEWLHQELPKHSSCRPIYVERSVEEAGFGILQRNELRVGGLFPTKLPVAVAEAA